MRIILLLLMGTIATACQPVTLAHEGRVDFTKYRSVYVQAIALSGDAVFEDLDTGTQNYLIEELQILSGFSSVVGDEINPTDAVLTVSMEVNSDHDFETGETRYTAETEYRFQTSSGVDIARGSTSSTNSDPVEAQEDALDDIALYFLRPYRI